MKIGAGAGYGRGGAMLNYERILREHQYALRAERAGQGRLLVSRRAA